MATTVNTTMEVEWNQSSSLPLSSISCIEPTQITSSASPIRSIGRILMAVSRSR